MRFMPVALGVAAIAFSQQIAAAEQPPSTGARCYGPSLPLGSNLPLGTSTSETDVVDAHAIRGSVSSHVVGWYYRNREGDRFIQVTRGYEQYVANLLSTSGAKAAANAVVGNMPYSFVAIDRHDADMFERSAASSNVLQSCFSHPLGDKGSS